MVLRSIATVAAYTGRHRTLIHQWIREGRLTAACDTRTRDVLVDLAEATRLSNATPRRRPRSLTQEAA